MRRFPLYCLVMGLTAAPVPQSLPRLSIVDSLKVGGEGSWDYLCLEPDSGRLFVPRGERVMVLGLDGTRIGEIPGTEGVHGVACSKALNRGWTSNGKSDSITVFSLDTLVVEKTVKSTGRKPDAILFDSATRRVFCANGHGDSITVLDGATSAVLGTVKLAGNPETLVSDGQGRVFVNIENRSEVVAIDARALKVEATWPLKPLEEPTGLALDAEHHLLFSVAKNKLMAIVDAASGRMVAQVPIGAGADAVAYDPGTGCAYASAGDGTLTVVRREPSGEFRTAAVATGKGAKTLALDASTHRLYLPTADFPHDAGTAKASPLAGTFHILVVGETR